MCSVAPRAAAPGLGATAFLDRQRGVVAATSRHNAGEPIHRSRASDASAAPARKRGRHDGLEHVGVHPAASSALRIRMDKELVALQGLVKRAKLLPRSDPPAENKRAPVPVPRRPEAPVVSSEAKRTTSSQPKAETEAAYRQNQITAPTENPKQQLRPVQRAAAKNPITKVDVPNKQRPSEAPGAAKQQQNTVHVQRAAAARTEAPRKRRLEEEKERARAAAREQFRQMLVEMEKSALPDETIYAKDLEELGIAPFEFVVTRTWKQFLKDQKVELGIIA